jgi:uncharacterized circularly permuted ATP-grasp superfamily protein
MLAFDEMNGAASAPTVRAAYTRVADWLAATPPPLLQQRRAQAEQFFRRIGITFAVYGTDESTERLIPFDMLPRVLTGTEWRTIEAGLIQRVTAINAFLSDLYGAQECLKTGLLPEELVFCNPAFRVEMMNVPVPHGVFVPIAGIDLVRTAENSFYVLEDNARTPSGVSYMLENREMMMRLCPELFSAHKISPVETYPDQLLQCLRSLAPRAASNDPVVGLLTPGHFNSAFYEHSFLADKLGIELVQGSDVFVRDDCVFLRTTRGPRRVDVLYRRIDDEFLDPLVFNPDSMLGVPGLFHAYKAGTITLANAVGTGVADDKAVYSYMPDIIRFFTGQEPILGNVPTWRCREPDALAYVLEHLHELVVKEVHGSGGYGMLVGPHATRTEIEMFRARLKAAPDNYIAQPTLALSTCPTFVENGIAPRHVDLRPFVLSGANGVTITPGGLTRVALHEGSLVVNSSQGGGTKDTWVLSENGAH